MQLVLTTTATPVNVTITGQNVEYMGDAFKTNDYDRIDVEMEMVDSTQCDLNGRPPSSQPCTTGIECAPITLGSGNIDIGHNSPIQEENIDNGDAFDGNKNVDEKGKIDGEEDDDDEDEEDDDNNEPIENNNYERKTFDENEKDEIDETVVEVKICAGNALGTT